MRYKEEMQHLVEAGYAERVLYPSQREDSGKVWYLPHHPVLNPNKPEKVRIVFDCAAPYKAVSLNSRVRQGPDLNNKLTGVILRFRQNKVALMADIEAMFHQVRVAPEDRDVLRFLWWMNGDWSQEPVTYRMVVHPFGGVWSPACAGFALQQTFKDHGHNYMEEVRKARHNFYVDDLLLSVPSTKGAIKIASQLRQLLSYGGFRLTKWICNDKAVLNTIPCQEKAKGIREVVLRDDQLPTERALGILWDLEDDILAVRLQIPSRPETKRGLLSMISSVYDPLGIAAPLLIKAKLIFQDECRRRAEWDTPMSDVTSMAWRQWLRDAASQKKIRIPRWYWNGNTQLMGDIQIHNFCDASQGAYGTVSYLRGTDDTGTHHVAFLAGKARLAPLKQQTIPRLELCAAVLAAKMNDQLRDELEYPNVRSVFWTDSMAVLQYIRNTERRFHTFVANRIATIHELSDSTQWRHIPSTHNPADDASRGVRAAELHRNCRWLQGPSFLKDEEAKWITSMEKIPELTDGDPEVKIISTALATLTGQEVHGLAKLWTYYSSWDRLLTGVAWLQRFVPWRFGEREERVHQNPRLSISEVEEAERIVIRLVQQEAYPTETDALKKGKRVTAGKANGRILEAIPSTDGLVRKGESTDKGLYPGATSD